MDALKSLVSSKRKALEEDPIAAVKPNKYMRKGDIERLKEEIKAREATEREKAEQHEAESKANFPLVSFRSIVLESYRPLLVDGEQTTSRPATDLPHPTIDKSSPGTPVPEATFNISNEETIRRLRAKGQPIRLFGETDKDRRLRLRALELIEEKGHERQGGQNDFKKALEDVENVEKELQKKNNKGKKKDGSDQQEMGVLDLGLIKTDPDKLYPIIYYALKRTLKEWGEAMDERPG